MHSKQVQYVYSNEFFTPFSQLAKAERNCFNELKLFGLLVYFLYHRKELGTVKTQDNQQLQ